MSWEGEKPRSPPSLQGVRVLHDEIPRLTVVVALSASVCYNALNTHRPGTIPKYIVSETDAPPKLHAGGQEVA